MNPIRILHTADLHLDSPFEGLSAGKAMIRRNEQRELLGRIADTAVRENVDIVLLSGDLLDSDNTYYETAESLGTALGSIHAPVVIAPGNHDYYSAKSPYAQHSLPENVYVFSHNQIESVRVDRAGIIVYGAAFTEKSSRPLLEGFHAPRVSGYRNLLCLHGEVGRPDSAYDPISEEQLAASGIDYAALGHIHKASGLLRAGNTWYSQPGCPEGRGFDETGEKTISIVELSDSGCKLRTVSVAGRRYETLKVNVTGLDPLLAVHTALPDDTMPDIYRIILTGEADSRPDLHRLRENLSEFFFELQLEDRTTVPGNLWDGAGTDSLRGIFLRRLRERYEQAKDDSERSLIEQAALWGNAAFDNREEPSAYED